MDFLTVDRQVSSSADKKGDGSEANEDLEVDYYGLFFTYFIIYTFSSVFLKPDLLVSKIYFLRLLPIKILCFNMLKNINKWSF